MDLLSCSLSLFPCSTVWVCVGVEGLRGRGVCGGYEFRIQAVDVL